VRSVKAEVETQTMTDQELAALHLQSVSVDRSRLGRLSRSSCVCLSRACLLLALIYSCASFVRSLRAGVQPTLNPSVETVNRPNALAPGREEGKCLVCSVCARRAGKRFSRREQLVGYFLTRPV